MGWQARMHRVRMGRALLWSLLLLPLAVPAIATVADEPPTSGDSHEATRDEAPDHPRDGLLSPIPAEGAVPPILDELNEPSESAKAFRARARTYEQQLRRLRQDHFGRMRRESIRQGGLGKLREFTDPAAFRPMIEVFEDEADDVRLAMLDHFAEHGEEGQAALAWVGIHDDDPAIRNEAVTRLTSPPGKPVLRVLDAALRSEKHEVANNAGTVAGAVNALEAIPLLIFAQATADPVPENEGDLAWIAIQTNQVYVAAVNPVVGEGAGAFQPIPGIVSEGTVLRVMDAVVVVYRTEIHRSLVAMTTHDWGQPTDHLGYDMRAWWAWYNQQYVPYKNAQARQAALEEASEGTSP